MQIGLLGFLAESLGLIVGFIVLYLFNIKSGKKMGALYGATSGLMLAMICFDIIPEALDKGRQGLVFVGIIIGALLGILLDESADKIEDALNAKFRTSINKAGLILVLGIAFHNFPEGFAFGTLGHTSAAEITSLALILGLHSIPEGIAMAIPFKKDSTPLNKLTPIGILMGIIMGCGATAGYYLSGLNDNLICTGLGLAAGLIMYIVCQELMPESRKIWNGRVTSISTILGLMFGILLLCH